MPPLTRRHFMIGLASLPTACKQPTEGQIETSAAVREPKLVDGYTDKGAYYPGELLTVFLNYNKAALSNIRLFDSLGRQVFSVAAAVYPQKIQNKEPWREGFGYAATLSLVLPDLPSGLYFWEGKVRFIVRARPDEALDLVVVYPSNTDAAYNAAGGKSFYLPGDPNHASEISFQRPLSSNALQFTEKFYPWLAKRTALKTGHINDLDMDDYNKLAQGRLLLLVGHNEYWSRQARQNFDAFVANGGHALVLSGNTMWWQIRYSADRSKLICYKNAKDPVADPLLVTKTWCTPALNYPILSSLGADFDHGGYGCKTDCGWDGYKIVRADSPIFNGAGLANGDILSMPSTELDGAPLSGFDRNGAPIIDNSILKFHRVDLLGYDHGVRSGKTTATWMVFQKTPTSGIVIHGASTDWGSAKGLGGKDAAKISIIMDNMIKLLLANQYPA